jgi:hypothetical protein
MKTYEVTVKLTMHMEYPDEQKAEDVRDDAHYLLESFDQYAGSAASVTQVHGWTSDVDSVGRPSLIWEG